MVCINLSTVFWVPKKMGFSLENIGDNEKHTVADGTATRLLLFVIAIQNLFSTFVCFFHFVIYRKRFSRWTKWWYYFGGRNKRPILNFLSRAWDNAMAGYYRLRYDRLVDSLYGETSLWVWNPFLGITRKPSKEVQMDEVHDSLSPTSHTRKSHSSLTTCPFYYLACGSRWKRKMARYLLRGNWSGGKWTFTIPIKGELDNEKTITARRDECTEFVGKWQILVKNSSIS